MKVGKTLFSEVWRPVFTRVGTCVRITEGGILEVLAECVPVLGSEVSEATSSLWRGLCTYVFSGVSPKWSVTACVCLCACGT